eukprot:5068420-Pyramimonas_sp.AAC.1
MTTAAARGPKAGSQGRRLDGGAQSGALRAQQGRSPESQVGPHGDGDGDDGDDADGDDVDDGDGERLICPQEAQSR